MVVSSRKGTCQEKLNNFIELCCWFSYLTSGFWLFTWHRYIWVPHTEHGFVEGQKIEELGDEINVLFADGSTACIRCVFLQCFLIVWCFLIGLASGSEMLLLWYFYCLIFVNWNTIHLITPQISPSQCGWCTEDEPAKVRQGRRYGRSKCAQRG